METLWEGTRSGEAMQRVKEAAEILKQHASDVDREGRFPVESLEALRKRGLMGFIISEKYGGLGMDVRQMASAAQILAGSCLSTAMIWSMHCQQVAVLVHHTSEQLKQRWFPLISKGDVYLASVTSEYHKGGDLLRAVTPLIMKEDTAVISRKAPVVTGGAYGDAFLITMKRSAESHEDDVVLVLAHRDQLRIVCHDRWDSLGMRGTHSIPMEFEGQVPREQILNDHVRFEEVALTSMVPVGHIGWVACWLGATKQAFQKVIEILRHPKYRSRFHLQSDTLLHRLARSRLKVDTVDAYLNRVIDLYMEGLKTEKSMSFFQSPSYNIQVNNLKIWGSETLYEVIDELINLVGMHFGYLKNDQIELERMLRDLKSATLMFHNDRLLLVNGKLNLIHYRLLPDEL